MSGVSQEAIDEVAAFSRQSEAERARERLFDALEAPRDWRYLIVTGKNDPKYVGPFDSITSARKWGDYHLDCEGSWIITDLSAPREGDTA